MMCSHTPVTTRPIANPENPLTKPPAKAAKTKRTRNSPSIGRSPKAGLHSSLPRLFRFAVGDLIEQRHAVGLGPKPDLAGIGEGGILDLEQLSAIEGHAEARAAEVDAQAVPGVGRNLDIGSVASLAADNVERTSDAVDGLVENDVVLEGIGPCHVVVVRVLRPPDDAGGAVLRSSHGLELDLDKAVLDAAVVLQQQRIGRPAGLLEHLGFRRRGLVAFDRPSWVARSREGGSPPLRRGTRLRALEADRMV